MSSPFNDERYKELLKGLEISEVKLSDVLNGVETFRLDAEYHAKEYETIENYIKNNPARFSKFANWNVGIDCSAFYPGVEPLYGTGDIPLIRVQNVKEEIEYDNCVTLPILPPEYDTLKFVDPGDIVITKGGSIGFVGYVTKRAYASRDLMFINSSQLDERERIFLYLYLSTNFSFKQLIRSSSQCAQPHLTITLVKNFDVFLPSEQLKDKCLSLYKEYTEKNDKSKRLYTEAEEILLKELGLKKWQPNNSPINIKRLKDSYLSSGRLDAEYYQSKFDDLLSLLSNYDCNVIEEIAHIKKSVEPGSEAYQNNGIPFVRVSDITKYGLSEPDIFLSPSDYSLEVLRPKKNTILLSKDGSVGIAYKMEKDMDCITSGALLHLTVFNNDYDPDYLTLVLNSSIVQLQAERDSSGAIIQHWKPLEIEQVKIPKLPMPIQKAISEKIQKSFELKAESTRLLERAKQMVETAIQ